MHPNIKFQVLRFSSWLSVPASPLVFAQTLLCTLSTADRDALHAATLIEQAALDWNPEEVTCLPETQRDHPSSALTVPWNEEKCPRSM